MEGKAWKDDSAAAREQLKRSCDGRGKERRSDGGTEQ
jgi:hypothetical protein